MEIEILDLLLNYKETIEKDDGNHDNSHLIAQLIRETIDTSIPSNNSKPVVSSNDIIEG
jgi:hypothetical protein